MGNGIIGKILYFWVFILGGLFFAKIFGIAGDDRSVITLCIALAVAYIVFQVARSLGRKKREEQAAQGGAYENRPPVRKGQSGKKRKKK
ncbi:MAG TPA: hypothetical protein IAC50_00895 [Candidatus Copromorpha excrementigallinarum]|uniref:Uncharacterized protein n=1 Tax=Candidatus Allocopromorpha excrementigallinarum TaxID=2840742 RepID=A0A9D1L5T9_9FIRM|nr:hypothetical protein [Candidatus Copromorpha excrementigallinarum]